MSNLFIQVVQANIYRLKEYRDDILQTHKFTEVLEKFIHIGCDAAGLPKLAPILIKQADEIAKINKEPLEGKDLMKFRLHASFQIVRRYYLTNRPLLTKKESDALIEVYSEYIILAVEIMGPDHEELILENLEFDINVDQLEQTLQKAKIEMLEINLKIEDTTEREIEIFKEVLDNANKEMERLSRNLEVTTTLLDLIIEED